MELAGLADWDARIAQATLSTLGVGGEQQLISRGVQPKITSDFIAIGSEPNVL